VALLNCAQYTAAFAVSWGQRTKPVERSVIVAKSRTANFELDMVSLPVRAIYCGTTVHPSAAKITEKTPGLPDLGSGRGFRRKLKLVLD
jgi:hypothetical protein